MKKKESTKYQTMIQFTYFAIIGTSGTLIYLIILYSLTEFFFVKYWISLPIGYFIGITNNFIWNRKYTFERSDKQFLVQYIEYLLSMLLGAILSFVTTIILTEYLHIWYFFSAIFSVVISTVIDFILSKLWVFGRFYIYIIDIDESPKEQLSVKLVVSCLNEEENVSVFVNELMTHLPPQINLILLLIDNGSSDQTNLKINLLAQKYPNNIIVLQRNKPLRYGESIIEGLNHFINIKPDYIGWAWSDNQITGKSVARIVSTLSGERKKFVKALRYEKDYSFWRKIQSFVFNIIISTIFQNRLQDVNGCPKFIHADLYPYLDLKSHGWFLDAEAILKISRLVKEDELLYVPVQYSERIHGKSKTCWFTAFELFGQILVFRLWGLRKWVKEMRLKKVKNINRFNVSERIKIV